MDADENEVRPTLQDYLTDGSSEDGEPNEDVEDELGKGTDWRSIKARLQTAGRSKRQIQPVEHRVRFSCSNHPTVSILLFLSSFAHLDLSHCAVSPTPPPSRQDMPELLRQWSTTFENSKKRHLAEHLEQQFAEWHSLLLYELLLHRFRLHLRVCA